MFDAITSIDSMYLINVKSNGNLGVTKIILMVFIVLNNLKIETSFVIQSSSEHNLFFSVDKRFYLTVVNELNKIFKKEIESNLIKRIDVNKNIAIITIIGFNMVNRHGMLGKIFSILGKNNINVMAISQGTSEISISFIVEKDYESRVLNLLHNSFI